ncbi:MAG: hypothetical protein ACNA8W_08820 [Bradymonadaceae bacterium]
MDEQEIIKANDMLEPIERLFERDYGAEHGFFCSELQFTNGHAPHLKIDLVYVGGSREHLHAVKILESYNACLFDIHEGIHALGNAPGNYLWIALPLEEFRDGEEAYKDIMLKTCQERGFGIITVQVKGRGLSAKVIQVPRRQEGTFLEYYQGVNEMWKDRVGTDVVLDGFQVVDYYER